jgi:hypothetical protein
MGINSVPFEAFRLTVPPLTGVTSSANVKVKTSVWETPHAPSIGFRVAGDIGGATPAAMTKRLIMLSTMIEKTFVKRLLIAKNLN